MLSVFSCVCQPSVCLLWRNVCLGLFPHFLIGLFVFLVLSCMSCLYVLEINPLSVVSFAIIFSHSEGCLFTLLIVSFAVQKLLSFIRSHLLLLFLFPLLQEVGHRGSCFDLCHRMFCLCFPLKSFIVSGLKFRSLIHFEFIFVYGVKKCSNFILLHVAVQFSQHHLLKRLSLPHCIFLPPLSNRRYPQVQGFISGLSIFFCWSTFLFLCHYHTVLMTIALQYNLKSGRLIPPALFFFFKIALAVQDLLCFHMNCEGFFCSRSVKKCHW